MDSALALELVALSDFEPESDDSLDSDLLSDFELESESDDSLDSADALVLLLRFP